MKEKKKNFSSEFQFIENLRKRQHPSSRTLIGIGDDCAVLKPPRPPSILLATTDLLTEGVHFDLSWGKPDLLGRKSVSVNVSDIAAMGGRPTHLLCSLAIPDRCQEILEDLMEGIEAQCEKFKIDFVGGDTNHSTGNLTLCHTLLGEGSPEQIMRRNGAKAGDLLFCSGDIGDSGLGLEILKKGKKTFSLTREEEDSLVEHFLNPKARLELGMQLAEMGGISAMIDISDGLIQDLEHILRESKVSLLLRPEKIPLSQVFQKSKKSWKEACAFGEDYELLFTAHSSMKKKILQYSSPDCPITCIGEICAQVKGEAQILDTEEKPIHFDSEGFVHF